MIPAILVDNHLINNVVFSLIDTDGVSPLPEGVWDHTWKVRDVALSTIRNLSRPKRNFIFTNELIQGSDIDSKLFDEISLLADQRSAKLLPVRLLISVEELCKRIISPDRKLKFKSVNAEAMRERFKQSEVFTPSKYNSFDLNVTELSGTESAKKIALELERRFNL